MISLNIEKTFGFISKEKVFAYEAEVKAAQEMLEKGISPLQTAMETGFSDQSHFNHFFVKLIGIPPATYKAIWQTNQYQ